MLHLQEFCNLVNDYTRAVLGSDVPIEDDLNCWKCHFGAQDTSWSHAQ